MSQKKHFKPVTSVPKGLTSRLGSKNKKYINTRKFTYRLSKTIQILRIQTCLSYLLSLPKWLRLSNSNTLKLLESDTP